MSAHERHHLEYSLTATLKDIHGEQVHFCPQHQITVKQISLEAHSKCRKVQIFDHILFSELNAPQRLEKIIHKLYGKSKKLHHPCGRILHISSYDTHDSSCVASKRSKKRSLQDNNEDLEESSAKKQKCSKVDDDDELALQVQVDDSDHPIHHIISQHLDQMKRTFRGSNAWKKYIEATQEFLITNKHNTLDLEYEMMHVTYYFCEYSKDHSAEQYQKLSENFSEEFPAIIEILEEKKFYQLLKAGSQSKNELDGEKESDHAYKKFLLRLESFFGTEEAESHYDLPGNFDSSEYSAWIGTLQDVLMRFSSAALTYFIPILSELNMSLKEKLESLRKKSVRSICIDQFLKKGCPVNDADPYVVLSLIIAEFEIFSSKFKSIAHYIFDSAEQLHKISSLKNVRDTISHMGCPNIQDASFAPPRLTRTRILQTLCSIAELSFEMRLDDLRAYIDCKISSLYPHQLIKLKLPKQVSDMKEEEKAEFWKLMDSAKSLGYRSVSIEFGSIIVSFYTFQNNCSKDQLVNHFSNLQAEIFPDIHIKANPQRITERNINHNICMSNTNNKLILVKDNKNNILTIKNIQNSSS
jgi:hypothetical protein